MPSAARQGDLTAHGGTIAVGEPTVLINGAPAARQGDMHVCPMTTGTVPHVGGPVAMGATTVLINKMPAARMGDMCACCGPPDVIAMGEPTVQINTGGAGMTMIGGGGGMTMIGGSGMTIIGGGGAAGGGGGAGVDNGGARAAMQSAAASEVLQPEPTELRENFLAARLTDASGRPVVSQWRCVTDADGAEDEGFLPGNGQVRRSGMDAEGDSTVAPRAVFGARWSTGEARVGDEVTVTAKAVGFDDGAPGFVEIKQIGGESSGLTSVALVEVEVSGGAVEATWAYAHDPDDAVDLDAGSSITDQMPRYVAEIVITGAPHAARTGPLAFDDTLETTLVDQTTGEPLRDTDYRIRLSSGEVRTGTTDGDGVLHEDNVPPGGVSFV